MPKDINIHLKTTGADKTQADLGKTAQSAKQLGEKTAEGQQQGGAATEQATNKLGVMGRMFQSLKSQVVGFVGAFLGLHAVIRLVSYLIDKLERIAELQKQIYDKSLQFAEIGQALEFQTGTVGRQQFWTEQALELQKAGALRGADVAQQMLVSMDIAFADQGGIKDAQIRELAKQLAPFVGAAGLGGQEVAKLFEFAGSAGIEPTAGAYKDYFAKLQAGYTASKATDFGQFMEALQKGGTAYMTKGGTLEEAISTFASARAVTANESLAATLVEQIARLSGGGYEKPRLAMEESLGIKWSDLSMDARTSALLRYVRRLPEATRTQTLVEQGFPQELTTGIGKMVSPEAMRTLQSTRQAVSEAAPSLTDEIAKAYIDSMLGKEREQQATIAQRQVKQGPDFAAWQRRLDDARSKFEDQAAIGQDRWIKDSIEPYVIALEEMQQQLLTPEGQPPAETDPAYRLWDDIRRARNKLHDLSIITPRGQAAKMAYELSQRFDAEVNPHPSAPIPVESAPGPAFPQPGRTPPQPPVKPRGQSEPLSSPPAIEPPPERRQPPPEPQGKPVSQLPPSESRPVVNNINYDSRVINTTILNPVSGVSKQDLLIEPPWLA